MAKSEPNDIDYAGLSQELAELLARLEQGDQSVDQAVKAYERGLQIVALLETHLKQAENKVTELKQSYDKLAGEEE